MSEKGPSILATKEWLLQNLTKSTAVAAHLWHLSLSTLRNSITRDKKMTPSLSHGGQNKVLTKV